METLTLINILFGVFNDNEDFAFLNHLILSANYFIYKCKLNKTKPTLRVFIEKIKLVYHLERKIAKRNDRLPKHYKKWEKYCLFFTKYQLKVFFFQRVSCTHEQRTDVKALVNEDTLLRTHCCPWCFLGCANWETFVADTKCFWTKSETFFVSRTQNWCP